MPRKVEAAEFDGELAAKLARFSAAANNSKSSIIRAAVAEFIERHLRENDGVREKYERFEREDRESAERRAAHGAPHLRVVK